MLAGYGLAEITAGLPHKRAFTRQAIMTELLLVQSAGERFVTDFRGQLRYEWPGDVLGTEIAGLPDAGGLTAPGSARGGSRVTDSTTLATTPHSGTARYSPSPRPTTSALNSGLAARLRRPW